jgi:CelD/BcsL family acetyltransferase involved in cellulose biosynthesis
MIQRVNPEDDPDWDGRLRDWPGASSFHNTAWNRVLCETYRYSPSTFVLRDGLQMRAVLPMIEVRSSITGARGISLPFTDHCNPLAENEEDFRRLFFAAVERGRARNWKYLEFRGGGHFFTGTRPSLSFHGHRVKLKTDTTDLFAQFDSSVRRAIRKAESSGVTVEFSRSMRAIQEFYTLLKHTRQRHGLPPQPFELFAAIGRYILDPGQGWVVLARQGSVAVAGAIFFHRGDTAIYKYGVSDESFQHLRGNNLVMWKAIQRYAGDGFQTMDLGRTSLRNEGLRRFKLGWGSAETQIDYFKYDLRTREFITAPDESTGWYCRVFNKMPQSLSQFFGTLLYKHIA